MFRFPDALCWQRAIFAAVTVVRSTNTATSTSQVSSKGDFMCTSAYGYQVFFLLLMVNIFSDDLESVDDNYIDNYSHGSSESISSDQLDDGGPGMTCLSCMRCCAISAPPPPRLRSLKCSAYICIAPIQTRQCCVKCTKCIYCLYGKRFDSLPWIMVQIIQISIEPTQCNMQCDRLCFYCETLGCFFSEPMHFRCRLQLNHYSILPYDLS